MTQVMTLTNAKTHLSELVSAVATTHDNVEITRNGIPAAILISVDELEALRETVAILSDPQIMADLRESEEDIAADRLTDAEDLRRILKIRLEAAEA